MPSSSLRMLNGLVKLSIGNNQIVKLENSSFIGSLNSLMFINLTCNRIEYIAPNAFEHLSSLTELYLSNNQIKTLKITSDLNNLEVLDLSENQFTSIPSELNFKKLRKLSLLGNKISTVEENDFIRFERLEYIDLSRNLIRSVSSQAFQYLSDLRLLNLATNLINKQSDLSFNLLRNQLQLETLDLSDNKIDYFPFQLLINQKNLKKLYLDYNQIDELNHEMLESLKSLEELSISFNLIKELKEGLFFYNRNLKLINLHANKIQTVNDDVFIGCSDNLLSLDLSNNDFSELPRLVMPRLIILNFSFNQFRELYRDQFINLPSLIYLNLSNTIMSNNLPDGIFDYNKKLEFLDLSHNEFESIEIGAFQNLSLKRINLSKNKIKELDVKTFEKLHNLEHLDLSNNEMIYIKNGAFYELPQLKTLNLAKNRFQSFRGELFSTTRTQVQYLDLSENSINYLYPSAFNIHQKLKVLKLQFNNLNYFPTELINTITTLEELDLSMNKLKSLDTHNFANMQRLKVLKLNGNLLDTIGANAFLNLTKLNYLDLSSNQLVSLETNSFRNLIRIAINLANNELVNLEDDLFDPDNVAILIEINLANNKFKNFPNALHNQATNLIKLDLSSNLISHLLSNTDLLINVKHLDISSNPLNDDAIRLLFTEPKSVNSLNVANTRINHLRFDTIEAPFIRHLNMSGNRLRSLNSSLFEKISLLEELDLSKNAFSDLKQFIDIWPLIPNLKTLSLSFNLFKSIQNEDFNDLSNLVSLDVSSLGNLENLECESISKLNYLSELLIYNYTMLRNYEPQECFSNNNRLTRLLIEIKSPELKGHLFNSYSTKLNQLMIYGPKLSKISTNFLYGIRSKHLELTLFNTSLNELTLDIFSSLSLKCEVQFNLISSNELLFSNNNLVELNNKQLNVRINRLSNVTLPCDCTIDTIFKMLNTKNQFIFNGQRKSLFLSSLIDQFDELVCSQPTGLIGSKLGEINLNEVPCIENSNENTSDNYSLISKEINNTIETNSNQPLVVDHQLSTTKEPASSTIDSQDSNKTTTGNYNLNHLNHNPTSYDKVNIINQNSGYQSNQDVLLTKSSIRKNKNNLKLKSNDQTRSNQVSSLSSLTFTKVDTIIIGSTIATILFILVLMTICCYGMRVKSTVSPSYIDSSYMNYGNLFGQPLTGGLRNQSSLESNRTCIKACHQSNHHHPSNHSPYSSSLNNSLINFSPPIYQQQVQNDEPIMFYVK